MQDQIFSDLKLFSKPLTECPLCKSSKLKLHYIIKKYNPQFKVNKCSGCGFIFMNPRFSDSILRDLYSENYYSGNAEYSYYDERDAEKYSQYVWKKRIEVIRQYVDCGNFLDVGCAFGGFLKTASEHFIPFGIELSEYSGNHAKSLFGNNIHLGSLADHPFSSDFFSVITMIELLEHISDPSATISECFRLLKNDGLLVVQTANMDALQAKLLKERYAYFMPGHVSYFTKNNLVGLLKRAGFIKVKIFYPVEFGLIPKLFKSRYQFRSNLDYLKWFRITYYHLISKIRFRDFAATSSMVIYAVK
jgi:2-polyprenyl-3-methyl-5-hydroxy-6-metoxy-1,4-benzoquinol methylase